MFIEQIPEIYAKKTMPVAASFATKNLGMMLGIAATKWHTDPHTGMPVPDPDKESPCILKAKGGRFLIENWELLRLVMNSSAYQNRSIEIDREDPTGFWRACKDDKEFPTGMVSYVVQEVVTTDTVHHPDFETVKTLGKDIKPGDVKDVKTILRAVS